MTDETTTLKKDEVETTNGGSKLFNVSIRGLLALMTTATVCTMGFVGSTVEEPLYTLAVGIIGFYFGQNTARKT
jgi:hypothetical protein